MTVEGDMVIREAGRDDCHELAESRWLLHTGDRQAADPAFREFARRSDGAPTSWQAYRHFVAETGAGGLVGCASLHHVPKLPAPPANAKDSGWGYYLTNCYVRTAWRGRGIGSRLIGAVREVARNEGMELLVVWPGERAEAFYRRSGFGDDGAPWTLAHGSL